MTPTVTPEPAEASRNAGGPGVWPLIAIAAAFGGLTAGAAVLWAQAGSAVFFEMIRSGLAACFG